MGSGLWFDYSVVNFYLLSLWYSLGENAQVGFLDAAAIESGTDPYLHGVTIPRFRKRFFLPIQGSCPLRPLISVMRQQNHFFAVYMDHRTRSVSVLGRTAEGTREDWSSWDGPEHYKHACTLHGWEPGDVSDIQVRYFSWKLNGFDCGPVAIEVSTWVFRNGFQLPGSYRDCKRIAESCHHITRIRIHEFLRLSLRRTLTDYTFFRVEGPEEWVFMDAGLEERPNVYGEVTADDRQILMSLLSPTDPTRQRLEQDISGCRQCMHLSRVHNQENAPPRYQGRDRSHPVPLDVVNEEEEHEGDQEQEREREEEQEEQNPYFQGGGDNSHYVLEHDPPRNLDLSRSRRLHMLKINFEDMCIERKTRRSRPCELPIPPRPLWPPYGPHFDEYFGGPTREDMRAFEDVPYYVPLNPDAQPHFKSCWTYFRDYGYRILPRFSHSFYMCEPMKLEQHVMPLVPEFKSSKPGRYFHEMHFQPRPIGRSGIPYIRTVVSTDMEILGIEEMIERVTTQEEKIDPSLLVSYFVKGRTESGKYICVDLERDAVGRSSIGIKSLVDVDSITWVGRKPKVASPVALLMTPSIKGNGGIKKHNHVYVEVLEPVTEEEASNYGPGRPWNERRIPLSRLPHTLFTKISGGNNPINCYIFFPRMMHDNEYTKKRATKIPLQVMLIFWDRFVLPSLKNIVGDTPKGSFYEFTVDNNLRKGSGKSPGKNALYEGISKQIDPDTFSSLIKELNRLLETHENQELSSRFKSFFFAIECKGFKLNTMDEDGSRVMGLLRSTLPQIHWDYALDRKNGELYMDVAFTHNPYRLEEDFDADKGGVTGIWNMEFLEESLGKAGFISKPWVEYDILHSAV